MCISDRKNSGYNDYRAKREEYRSLQTVKGNIEQTLSCAVRDQMNEAEQILACLLYTSRCV